MPHFLMRKTGWGQWPHLQVGYEPEQESQCQDGKHKAQVMGWWIFCECLQ